MSRLVTPCAEAGRERDLTAPKRRRERAPDQAAGAVRADDRRRATTTRGRVDLESTGERTAFVTRDATTTAPARRAASTTAPSNSVRLATTSACSVE